MKGASINLSKCAWFTLSERPAVLEYETIRSTSWPLMTSSARKPVALNGLVLFSTLFDCCTVFTSKSVACQLQLRTGIDSLRKHVWKLDWIGPVLNLTTRSCCRRKLLLCAFTQTVWSWWNRTWKPQQPEMFQQSVLSTVRVLEDEMTKVPRCCRYLGNSISSPRPLAQFTKCGTKCSRRHLKTASPRSLWHAVSGTQTCGQMPQYHDTTKASKVGWTWKRGEVFSNRKRWPPQEHCATSNLRVFCETHTTQFTHTCTFCLVQS